MYRQQKHLLQIK